MIREQTRSTVSGWLMLPLLIAAVAATVWLLIYAAQRELSAGRARGLCSLVGLAILLRWASSSSTRTKRAC